MGELRAIMRAASADVSWDYAVRPEYARQVRATFARFEFCGGGSEPEPDEASVRAEFGDRAARAWAAGQKARRDFFAAVHEAANA